MTNDRKQLIVVIGYYILAILVTIFFYKEKTVNVGFVQMVSAILFLFSLPMIIIKYGFGDNLVEYNWPVGYIKKQLILTGGIVVAISLFIWLFVVQWGGGGANVELVWNNKQTKFLILNKLFILPIGLLAQEFFFRGFLLEVFRKNFNKFIAAVLVAVLAGMFSMFLVQNIFEWKICVGIFIANMLLGGVVFFFRSVIFSFLIYWLVTILLVFYTLYQLSQNIVQ